MPTIEYSVCVCVCGRVCTSVAHMSPRSEQYTPVIVVEPEEEEEEDAVTNREQRTTTTSQTMANC